MNGLLKDRLIEEGERIAGSKRADTIEFIANRESSSTLRFSSSRFHQGISVSDASFHIRVTIGRKIGVASTNSIERGALDRCLDEALSIARSTREEPFLLKIPGPCRYAKISSFFESTERASNEEKALLVSTGFRDAGRSGVLHSGALSTAVGEIAVVNSRGLKACHPYTFAHLSSVASKGDASGFESSVSNDLTKIDVRGLMSASAGTCLKSSSPGESKPGVYRVLLEPAAVSELVHWLSYTGFGAKGFHDGTSFVSERLGEAVTGEKVTIYDDGLDANGMAVPFDFEGSPKRRLSLIDKGVASGVAYDSVTASIEGRESTGHGPFPGDNEGPFPEHVFMEGGDAAALDMLPLLGDGILVKSFHYVNGLLNPRESLMTGMTRHGTFLVSGGAIKCALRPMRFTENILEAFRRIEAVSRETAVYPNGAFPLGSVSVPYVLIDGFSFTS